MKEGMRLLIGYEGSTYADAALDDLRRAGLPRELDALVVSVGDLITLPQASGKETLIKALTSRRVTSAISNTRDQLSHALEEARDLSTKASQRVQSYFPEWRVSAVGVTGNASEELIHRAAQWKADLIVVGSQGRSALGRFFLGSVSKAVANEANCSVRVVRPVLEKSDDAHLRIMVGVDGSPGAERPVRAVGERLWPEGTEVRIITVDDGVSPTRIANINPSTAKLMTGDNEGEAVKARVIVERAIEELRALGLNASPVIKEGNPQTVLIEEARKSAAACIFVGARGFDTVPKKSGLGSVATGLVTNAPCTVEIVR